LRDRPDVIAFGSRRAGRWKDGFLTRVPDAVSLIV
jgi:hypothetical protein